MRGELDFTASLRQRVATLKDADANIFAAGSRRAAADAWAWRSWCSSWKRWAGKWRSPPAVSTFFAEYLRDKLHLDAVFANELEIRDGKLTGNVLGDIVDAKYKANTLRKSGGKV